MAARIILWTLGLITVGTLVLFAITAGRSSFGPDFVLILLAFALVFGGKCFILLVAFRESFACGIFCLIIPFYNLYFILTRFDQTWRPFSACIAGVVMLVVVAQRAKPKPAGTAFNSGSGSIGQSGGSGENGGGTSGSTAGGGSSIGRAGNNAAPTAPPPDPARERVKGALAMLTSAATADRNDCSRERAMQELQQLKQTLRQEHDQGVAEANANNVPVSRFESAWLDVTRELASLESRLNALPSEAPDPQIFRDPVGANSSWTVRAAAATDEICFRSLRLRPPEKTLLDLTSSEQDEQRGLVWTRDNDVSLSIKQVRKSNPRQRQPWLINRHFLAQAAERDHLLAIDTRELNVTPGSISGIPFWRVSVRMNGGQPVLRYIASVGSDWLIAEITAPSATSAVATEFENAIRSLRPAQAGEARSDPFAPERIAPRLADKPEEVLALLHRYGSKAEPVVLPMLASAEPRATRAAASFLVNHATAAAIPHLRKAIDSSDAETAAAARLALRRLTPLEFDALAEALLDLKSKENGRCNAAVKRLMSLPRDAARRPQVAALLEDLLLADAGDIERDAVGVALEHWFSEKTVARLLPLLSKEDADPAKRDAAIRAVSGTGSKIAAGAVIRWLIKEPEKTVAALIKLGPAAEESAVKVYNARAFGREQEDLTVRANLVRVLSEVGVTSQALQVLARAAKDGRDLATQETAKLGIEAVKARIAAARPATRPVTAKS